MNDKDLAEAISETIRIDRLSSIPSWISKSGSTGVDELGSRNISDKLVVFHQPRSLEAEYFRYLKSLIENHFEDHHDFNKSRVILVTGASRGSGKTTCALNLALSFAKSYGNQVLYLDGDIRRPKSNIYLGFGREFLPGLSEVLNQKERAGNVLINTQMSDLIYFPSGRFTENFVDRLRSEELNILMASLKDRFRYIIFDSPPSFPMPEPAIFARQSDGVLMVLGSSKDGQSELEQSLEALKGSNIIGTILNNVRKSPSRLYRRYGYRSQEY